MEIGSDALPTLVPGGSSAAEQRVLPSLMEVSVRVHTVAALVAALLSACEGQESAAPVDAGAVEVITVVVPYSSTTPAGSAAANPSWKPGERLRLPATIRSESSAIRLRLDDRSVLSLAPGTTLSIAPTSPLSVTIRQGTASIDRAEGTAATLRLAFGGTPWELPAGSCWVAVRADGGGGTMTVHRGQVSLVGKQEVLRAGQTVRQHTAEKTIETSLTVPPVLVPATTAFAREATGSFGRVVARVPGTDKVVEDARITSVRIRSSVRNGIVRTEFDQVLSNPSNQGLEAHLTLPLPARANLSGLSLWVGDDPMVGEIVERTRGVQWMRALVDATVPRDPALLHPSFGDQMVLRVFPLPAKGERRVSHVYETLLPVYDSRATLRLPLSSSALASVDRFSLDIDLGSLPDSSSVSATGVDAKIAIEGGRTFLRAESAAFKPAEDVVVTFPVPADASWFAWDSKPGREVTFAYRLRISEQDSTLLPWRGNRVFVLDRSASQTSASLRRQTAIVRATLERAAPDEQFALVACDRSCESYPSAGMARANTASILSALRWVDKLTPRGSTDLGGAILFASKRLGADARGQLVVMGDGRISAGRLWVDGVAAAVEGSVRGADVRILGVGSGVDDAAWTALAERLGASYARVTSERSSQEAALALRVPLVKSVRLIVPDGVRDVFPSKWPALRPGQYVLIVGKASSDVAGPLVIRGTLGGRSFEFSATPAWGDPRASGNPAIERLWAAEAIRELEVLRDDASRRKSIALSKRHHVLSRHTAMIALDSNEQFARFGITRTLADDGTEDYFGQHGAKQGALEDRWVSTGRASPACCPPSDLICNMRAAAGDGPRRRRVEPSVVFAPAKQEERPGGVPSTLPTRRDELASLAHELLLHLAFNEAATVVDALVKLDPTSRIGHELSANVWAGQGQGTRAVDELDVEAELDPGDVWAHERAARAFEVVGDRNAACAHWRSVVELDPSRDHANVEAIRCRAVVDVAGALSEARGIKRPTVRMRQLIEALEKKRDVPDYDFGAGAPGAIEVEVECATQRDCPVPIVVTPKGEVLSPWTPSSARSGKSLVGVARIRRGKYRVLLVGGSLDQGGRLLVRALGRRHQIELGDWAAVKVLNVTIQ